MSKTTLTTPTNIALETLLGRLLQPLNLCTEQALRQLSLVLATEEAQTAGEEEVATAVDSVTVRKNLLTAAPTKPLSETIPASTLNTIPTEPKTLHAQPTSSIFPVSTSALFSPQFAKQETTLSAVNPVEISTESEIVVPTNSTVAAPIAVKSIPLSASVLESAQGKMQRASFTGLSSVERASYQTDGKQQVSRELAEQVTTKGFMSGLTVTSKVAVSEETWLTDPQAVVDKLEQQAAALNAVTQQSTTTASSSPAVVATDKATSNSYELLRDTAEASSLQALLAPVLPPQVVVPQADQSYLTVVGKPSASKWSTDEANRDMVIGTTPSTEPSEVDSTNSVWAEDKPSALNSMVVAETTRQLEPLFEPVLERARQLIMHDGQGSRVALGAEVGAGQITNTFNVNVALNNNSQPDIEAALTAWLRLSAQRHGLLV